MSPQTFFAPKSVLLENVVEQRRGERAVGSAQWFTCKSGGDVVGEGNVFFCSGH